MIDDIVMVTIIEVEVTIMITMMTDVIIEFSIAQDLQKPSEL